MYLYELVDSVTGLAPSNGITLNQATGAIELPVNTNVGKINSEVYKINFKMFSGSGSGTYGNNLLFDSAI
jgi:hypothetical protein